MQIVFQDPYRSLNPRRTIGEAMIEGPMNYGATHTAALATARKLLDLVQIDAAALGRYPHQFSGGQRQRICIARALAIEPDLLIADEAVSALDVSVQAQVLALLDEIRGRLNLAMLFITHDLRVAAQVCDRVAVMQRGRIVETGPTAEVYAHPRHEYTRALLAAAPGRDWDFGVPRRETLSRVIRSSASERCEGSAVVPGNGGRINPARTCRRARPRADTRAARGCAPGTSSASGACCRARRG